MYGYVKKEQIILYNYNTLIKENNEINIFVIPGTNILWNIQII